MFVTVTATFLSLFCAVCAAYAIERLRYRGSRTVGMLIFLAYLVPPSILFIPLAIMVFSRSDPNWALVLTYPTFLIPFCTWLLMGTSARSPMSSRNAPWSTARRACRSWSRSSCRFRCRA